VIELGSPRIDDRELAAVREQLASGDLSTGDVVADFEDDCAQLAGRDHAVAVASGSVALELALHTADLVPGSGVVVSPYNCGAVLFSLLREDLVPVFADVDPDTYGLDPHAAIDAIEASDESVEAILAVHLYGLPCSIGELDSVAADRELTLIEDFAQAPGARVGDRPVGSFGDVGVASFGATKNITTAEGGVVVTDDESIASRVRALRSNTGETTDAVPRSVRMNDLEAAIGREQVAKYDEILETKRSVARIYDERLPDDVQRAPRSEGDTHVFHGYPIMSEQRAELSAFLADRDVASAAVYDTPLYDYPHVGGHGSAPADRFPETRRLAETVLLLPIHGSMSEADARTVADAVSAFFE